MRILIVVILTMSLFGCKSNENENEKEILIDYFIEKYVPILEKYVENDNEISKRDKLTFQIQLNEFKEKFKNQDK